MLLGRDAMWNNLFCLDSWVPVHTSCSVLSRQNRAVLSVIDASAWAVDRVLLPSHQEQLLLLRLGSEGDWICVISVHKVSREE